MWNGVSLNFDASKGAVLRSTYRLEPYADAAQIRLRYNAPVHIESDGTLAIAYAWGEMRESAPRAWQENDGMRLPVAVAFQTSEVSETSKVFVGFRLGEYDPALPLFIDPTLTWNTFLGGGGTDYGFTIAVDGSGNVYVAGESSATWGSPVRAYTGDYDAFAAKLDSSGELTWNTFLGGSLKDYCWGIDVDGSGNVYVAGLSKDTWESPVRPFTYGYDGFTAKLDSNGGLTWNTFLGGEGADLIYDIAVDGSGNVYVAGYASRSWGFPVRPYTSGQDAFAARLDSNGGLTWNTFLGGSTDDFGWGIAVDGNSNAYVVGTSNSSWGSPIRLYTSGDDAFAARLDSSGGLGWNTFLGGSGMDRGRSIALDGSDGAYVAGYGDTSWGSPVRLFTSGEDAFAARLDSSGGLTWNTFLGGSGTDYGYAIALDGDGSVYVAGYGDASWGTPMRLFTAGWDAFAARLDSGGLTWNTFLGGNGWDESRTIAVDGTGNVYAAGYSNASWNSPVRLYTGDFDAFAAKLPPNQFDLFLPLVVR
ncbi:MAG: hypothetical protein A2Z16_15265 [Chloroflexi bacterium RBG_16_54_18]|nr:MAG: hypothetical protein A2Z16_15265 [Chloroflexi bacterium RBG_16_54_18]